MIRFVLLACVSVVAAPAVRADAILVPLTGTGSKPSEYGYTVRAVTRGKAVLVCLDLTPAAAKAFGHGELTATKGGSVVVEATVAIQKDDAGKGTLKLTIDPKAIDGGDLTVWSAPVEGAPASKNFGGFRLAVAELLRMEDEDRVDAVMTAMDGFRTKLPAAQGLVEMNGFGVPDINGDTYPDSHLGGIATRLNVTTKAECVALMTYLTDPDPKMRRIAAFAVEGVVKAYPGGMSSSDIQDVASEGHRKLVKAFTAGIEKLTK